MADDARSTIHVDANTAGARSELGGLGGVFGGLFGTIAGGVTAGNILTGVVTGVIGGIARLGSAVAGWVGDSVRMNATLETSALQFETLMGSADRAKDHVAFLFEFAKKTPFETGPIIQASRIMQTFGGDALNTAKNMQMVGDAAAATSAPIDQVATWTARLYANLQAGKPIGDAAQELGRLGVLAPKARNEMEALAKGVDGGSKAWGRFQEEMGRFGGAMEKQAMTWSGLTSTFSDTTQQLGANAFKPLFDLARSGLSMINGLLDNLMPAAKNFGIGLGEAFRIVGAVLAPVIQGFFGSANAAAKLGDSTEFVTGVTRALLQVFSLLLPAFAGLIRGAASVISAWYELRQVGYLLLQTFGEVIERILVDVSLLTGALAKIPGPTQGMMKALDASVKDSLGKVRADIAGLDKDTKALGDTKRAITGELGKLANGLDAAGKTAGQMARTYQYVAPAAKEAGKETTGLAIATDEFADNAGKKGKDAAETFAKKLVDLTGSLKNAKALTDDEFMKKFGNDLESAAIEMKLFGITGEKVPPAVRAGLERLTDIKIKEFIAEQNKELAKVPDLAKLGGQEFVAQQEAMMKALGRSLDAQISARKELAKIQQTESFKAAEYEIEQAKRAGASRQTIFEMERALSKRRLDAAIADANAEFAERTKAIDKTTTYGRDEYNALEAVHKAKVAGMVNDWERGEAAKIQATKDAAKKIREEGIEKLSAALAQLAEMVPNAFKGLVSGAAGIVGSINGITKSVDVFKTGWGDIANSMKPGGGGIMGMIGGMGQIGAAISGLVAVAGTAWKGIKGIFGIKDEWQKIAADVTSSFGVTISEGLAKEIAAIAKTIKGGTAASRREIAEALSLSKIIQEGGGLNDSNVNKYIAQANLLFDVIKKGGENGAKATNELNTVFAMFAKHVTDGGKLATDSFLKLLQQAQATGKEIGAVTEYLKGQINTNIVGGLKLWADSATKASLVSQDAANALVGSLAAAFTELRKQGVATGEIIKTLSPIIEKLDAQLIDAGLDGGEAFTALRSLAKSAGDEIVSKATSAVDGLNKTMMGLHNIGLLDESMFRGLSAQIGKTFADLVAQGKNGNDAMRLMQPTLQTLDELQRKFGWQVDETTQKLLDEARTSGIVGKQYESDQSRMVTATERMADVLERMARFMGVNVPEASNAMGNAGVNNLEKIAGTIRGGTIPTFDTLHGVIQDENSWRRMAGNAANTNADASSNMGRLKGAVYDMFGTVQDSGPWNRMANEAASGAARARGEIASVDAMHPIVSVGWDIPSPRIPDLPSRSIRVDWDIDERPDIPQFASGGIVTRPTLAIVGEAGPEIIAPLPDWAKIRGQVESVTPAAVPVPAISGSTLIVQVDARSSVFENEGAVHRLAMRVGQTLADRHFTGEKVPVT